MKKKWKGCRKEGRKENLERQRRGGKKRKGERSRKIEGKEEEDKSNT